MKRNHKNLFFALGLIGAFVLWTALLGWVDAQPIGPQGSRVGFATVNRFVHSLTGVHMGLYALTDWLGLVPVAFGLGFAILGLTQLLRRRRLLGVDRSILVLGGFYILVATAYALFELLPVNYRPVLIEGRLEASYPSSTTMLVLCVMPTAAMQLRARIQNTGLRRFVCAVLWCFAAFMVIGRLISGVHWLTDIVGGGLLSAGLVTLYRWAVCLVE